MWPKLQVVSTRWRKADWNSYLYREMLKRLKQFHYPRSGDLSGNGPSLSPHLRSVRIEQNRSERKSNSDFFRAHFCSMWVNLCCALARLLLAWKWLQLCEAILSDQAKEISDESELCEIAITFVCLSFNVNNALESIGLHLRFLYLLDYLRHDQESEISIGNYNVKRTTHPEIYQDGKGNFSLLWD